MKARANIETFGATYGLVADARLAVADGLSRLPMGVFTRNRRAVVADLLTGRFGLYQDVVSQVWGSIVANAALPVFLALILAVIDWRVAAVAVAFVPVAALAIPWSHRLLARAADRLAGQREDLVAGLLDQIEGARDLRHYDRDAFRRHRLEGELAVFEQAQMRAELAPAPALLVFAFLLHLGFAATALAAALLAGGEGGSPAGLVLLLVLGLRFGRAVLDLGLNLAEARFARETLARMRALVAEPPLPEPTMDATPADASIALDGVSFAYDATDDTAALYGIDGIIPAGSMVALVGPSGSGKSTLAHLIGRLWDVGGGAIRIGGVDVRAMTATTLAGQVALVLQDVVLFEGSIADNIRLGRPEASDAEVEHAAHAARAHEFITALPDGYATCLDAEGGPLSGGERQRVAIARALLKDAPILVLDEATASIDPGQETEIRQALGALMRGRTVVAIAHRLWTVVDASQIWVMEGGRIVQRGTHDVLFAEESGLYRRLWDAQEGTHSWRIGAADE